MTAAEILAELRKFPASERLSILATALLFTTEEIRQATVSPDVAEDQAYPGLASKIILPRHQAASDLRESTVIDSEDFYDWG